MEFSVVTGRIRDSRKCRRKGISWICGNIWHCSLAAFIIGWWLHLHVCLSNFCAQGARGFPGTPGPPGLKGHRVSKFLISRPHLRFKSLTCLQWGLKFRLYIKMNLFEKHKIMNTKYLWFYRSLISQFSDHVNSFCIKLESNTLLLVSGFWISLIYMLFQYHIPLYVKCGNLTLLVCRLSRVHMNFQSIIVLELLTDYPSFHQFCLECLRHMNHPKAKQETKSDFTHWMLKKIVMFENQ